MRLSSFAAWGALALLATCWRQQARAELPPSAYPDPNSSSEVVDIEVLSASKSFRLFASSFTVLRYEVEVVAKVKAVHRSATGLKPGSKITIRYDAHDYTTPGWCGPGSFPILEKGTVCKAHLIEGGRAGVYTPWGAPYNAFEGKTKKR